MNYRQLASKGRYGDTKIRNVGGERSHVNVGEARDIDLYGMLGERLVQNRGAGTINPSTGLKEYHSASIGYEGGPNYQEMPHTHDVNGINWDESITTDMWAAYNQGTKESSSGWGTTQIDDHRKEKKYWEEQRLNFNVEDYREAYAKTQEGHPEYNPNAVDEYYTSIGIPSDKVSYFESSLNQAYIGEGGFIARQKEMAEEGAQKTYQFGREKAAMDIGKNLFSIKGQTEAAMKKTGFETHGGVTSKARETERGVFGDYRFQQKQLAYGKDAAKEKAGFDYETGVSDYWHEVGQDYWDTLAQLEEFEEM